MHKQELDIIFKFYISLGFTKWWGDGTSRNDVYPYECSWTPGPLYESSWKHNIPALKHPCNFEPSKTLCIMHNDRAVSIQGHGVTRED